MSLTETKKPSSKAQVPAADGPVPRSHNAPPRRRRARTTRRPPLPPLINDDQVLTFAQWCALNAFSERTGRRVLASGAGPIVTELSAARIGVTVGNNRIWQHSRSRA